MKKKIFIVIFIIFIVTIIIFAFTYIKKVLLLSKIKEGINNRSEFYHYKYTDNELGLNNDFTYEHWVYPNNNYIYNRSNFMEIIFNGSMYGLNKKSNIYTKQDNINKELMNNNKIDKNTFLPGDENRIDMSSFKLALNLDVEVCNIKNQECYKITNKKDNTSTYLNTSNFDLIKIESASGNSIDYEWEILEKDLTQAEVNELLKNYKESTFEEFSKDIEY